MKKNWKMLRTWKKSKALCLIWKEHVAEDLVLLVCVADVVVALHQFKKTKFKITIGKAQPFQLLYYYRRNKII